MRKLKVLLILVMVIVVIAGSSIDNGFGQVSKVSVTQEGEEAAKLPTIETPDKLKELVVKAYENQNRNSRILGEGLTKDISVAAGAAKRAALPGWARTLWLIPVRMCRLQGWMRQILSKLTASTFTRLSPNR